MSKTPTCLNAKLVALNLTILTPVSLSAQTFTDLEIDFTESAFTNGTITGTTGYNIIDDVTGNELTSDNGDMDDLFISVTTSVPTTATGAMASVEIASNGIVSNHAYSNTFQNTYTTGATNNPGSLIKQTIRMTFASHLEVTDFVTDFSSLNTAGITWEYTQLALLQADGSYFSVQPVIGDYDAWSGSSPQEGSPAIGWWNASSTGTVNGVGTDQVTTGSSGADQNFTTTNGDSVFTYNDVGLAAGTQVGGFEWTVYLEDVRGQNNGASNLTARQQYFEITGGVVPIPESSSSMLIGLAGLTLMFRRKR